MKVKGKENMTKDQMLEEMVTKYHLTLSEYDPFFNRYSKLTKESIRRIYEKMISGKYQNRQAFEKDIEKIREYEKSRLHTNNRKIT